MKYKTYNNMVKAVKILMNKGYDKETASDLAIKAFDNANMQHMPVEIYLDKILPYSEWKRQSENFKTI